MSSVVPFAPSTASETHSSTRGPFTVCSGEPLRFCWTAMANAGYTTAQYRIVVQTYPSPVPNGSGFRYSQSGFTRQSTGGCGFWNNDANWANSTALVRINQAVTNGPRRNGQTVP